jgi:hypothetical protein
MYYKNDYFKKKIVASATKRRAAAGSNSRHHFFFFFGEPFFVDFFALAARAPPGRITGAGCANPLDTKKSYKIK